MLYICQNDYYGEYMRIYSRTFGEHGRLMDLGRARWMERDTCGHYSALRRDVLTSCYLISSSFTMARPMPRLFLIRHGKLTVNSLD